MAESSEARIDVVGDAIGVAIIHDRARNWSVGEPTLFTHTLTTLL